MTNKLIQKPLSVQKSLVNGYGVFAEKDFVKDELIEECYMLLTRGGDADLTNYYFTAGKLFGLPLGLGCVYNHAIDPNAMYKYDSERQLMVVTAVRSIAAGDEIFISYGNEWFASRSMPIKAIPGWRKVWRFFAGAPLRAIVIFGLIYLLIKVLKDNYQGFVHWFWR